MPTSVRQRGELLAAVRRLESLGLNRGSTGNVSLRCADGYLITPSGMPAEALGEGDLVLALPGGSFDGAWQPSTEWPFHAALYAARPEIAAIVHTHSVNATAVACLNRSLPSFHYMVAVAGGDSIRCAPYRLFGTDALSTAVVEAMQGRKACLLAHHGLVAVGADLAAAIRLAVEVEALCEIYLKIAAVEPPQLLGEAEMEAVIDKFRSYGQVRRAAAGADGPST